jgi:UDP-N-acetylmuramate dehydrogenase
MITASDHFLSSVRGKWTRDSRLSSLTWFQVGGAADVLFRPEDVDDLAHFLDLRSPEFPYFVLGKGSNLLVRDGGVRGIVIRLLGPAFNTIRFDGSFVEVGAGCLDRTVALSCRDSGLGGLEFLIGIPGTIGGALRMNAGAYGKETKDVLIYAEALDPQGKLHRLEPKDMGFTYRHCAIPPDWIFIRAVLKGDPQPPEQIEKRLSEILHEREASQPTRGRTGGSTFRNPEGEKAWFLIDRAGCRGLQRGDAQVSPKHCNFLLNLGQASAKDIEELGEEVRQRVLVTSGVDLQWEVIRWGDPVDARLLVNS